MRSTKENKGTNTLSQMTDVINKEAHAWASTRPTSAADHERSWLEGAVFLKLRETVLATCAVERVFSATLGMHDVHGEGVAGVEGEAALVAMASKQVVA